jgi:alpha-2-macroglobulin
MGISNSSSYIFEYLYWCPEQSVSKLIPALSYLELMKAAKLEVLNGYTQDQYAKLISNALQRLVSIQQPDGGWGWWGTVYRSDPVISALVFDGLVQAKDSGQTVDPGVLGKAVSYLQQNIKSSQNTLDVQAMILAILSQYQPMGEGYLNSFMDRRWQMSNTGRAYLLHALQNQQKNSDFNQLYNEIMAGVKKDNTLAHWEESKGSFLLSNNQVLTALVLEAMVEKDPKSPLINDTVRWLIQARKGNHWTSTRDTSVVIRSVIKTMLAKQEGTTKENWRITLADKNILEGTFESKNLLDQKEVLVPISDIPKGSEITLGIDKSGTGSVYYHSDLSYYLPFEKTEALERGLVLVRELVDTKGNLIETAKVAVNEELFVRLTLVAPTQLDHVMIEDMLPAGFEAVNESLATTAVLNTEGLKPSKEKRNLYFEYQEMHDDRVMLSAPYVPKGVYEYSYRVRTTTPGSYHHPPAQAYNMYYPDVFGHSAGDWLEVTPR